MQTALKWIGIVFASLIVLFFLQRVTGPADTDDDDPTLSEFIGLIGAGEVRSVTFHPRRGELEVLPSVTADTDEEYEVAYPEGYTEALIEALREENVPFAVQSSGAAVASWFIYLLPFALLAAFWIWLARRLGGIAERLDALGERRPES